MRFIVWPLTVLRIAAHRAMDAFRSAYWTAELRRQKFSVGAGLRVKKGAEISFARGAKLQIGSNVTLAPQARIYVGAQGQLQIGNDVFLGVNAVIAAHTRIVIGEATQIAHNATLIDHDHDPAALQRGEAGAVGRTSPIEIGRYAWIGANALVLKGVSLGDRAVLAAGAVATKAIPAGAVARGTAANFQKSEYAAET